ncbi:MAG: hypothetical protein AB7O62_20960 [Pirellulales bacterium]
MSLKILAQNELSRLPAGAAPHTMRASDGPRVLRCELAALDTLGCEFTWLSVATDGLAAASPLQLQKISDALSQRLTYLLEPISPIEVDSERCVVQMRSNPPQKNESGSSYYELLVRRGGEISLCRFEKAPGQQRQVVPAQVTREVLLRIIGDLEAVLP